MESCVADGPHSRSVQPGEQPRQTSGLRNSLPLLLFLAGVVLSDWAPGLAPLKVSATKTDAYLSSTLEFGVGVAIRVQIWNGISPL